MPVPVPLLEMPRTVGFVVDTSAVSLPQSGEVLGSATPRGASDEDGARSVVDTIGATIVDADGAVVDGRVARGMDGIAVVVRTVAVSMRGDGGIVDVEL